MTLTVLAQRVPVPSPRRSALRRLRAWHPEWWVYAVAAAAWIVLLAMTTAMDMPVAGPHSVGWSERWLHWLLMVLAMMLPVAARQVAFVGRRSLWSRRQRSATAFVLGYVALWAVLGAALVSLVLGAGLDRGSADLLVVSLLLAAAWQCSVPRRRLVRRCESLRLRAPTGLAADVDCVRAGVRSALRCLQECWPAMIAMALSQSLLLMVGLTVVLLTERARGPNPQQRAGRPREAWALAGLAAVALAVALT